MCMNILCGHCNLLRNFTAQVLTIKNLRQVRDFLFQVRLKWYNIGLELGIDVTDLDEIKYTNNDIPRKCLLEMLKVWLNLVENSPTWKALSKALRTEPIDELALAEDGVNLKILYSTIL